MATKIVKFPVATVYSINPNEITKEISDFLTNNPTITIVSLSATSLFDGSNGQNAAYLIYTQK